MFNKLKGICNDDDNGILADNYVIKINDFVYDIPSSKTYNNLKTKFMNYLLTTKIDLENKTMLYKIIFLKNQRQELLISLVNREFVIDLLEHISTETLLDNLQLLNLN
jgi:hypothetical protein